MNIVLVAILCLNVLLLAQLYINTHVYPNTFLGAENIAGRSPASIEKLADRFSAIPYELRVQNRSYMYTYNDLGVSIDQNQLHALVFAPNKKWFPIDIVLLLKSLIMPRHIDVPLVFTQNFSRFIEDSVYDFSDTPDAVVFDTTDKDLTYVENEEKYRLDESYFVSMLRTRVGDTSYPLYPKLVKLTNYKELTVADTSDRIKQIFLEPLTVLVEQSSLTKSFVLSETELSDMTVVELSPGETAVTLSLNPTVVKQIFDNHTKLAGVITKSTIATPLVQSDLKDILMARYNGITDNALAVSFDRGPNTDGSYADKYIEVDISQQKMYIFNNGKLVNEYPVSTGKDYPTPTGSFKILNKVGLGYSAIYNVWMPWWMGFDYSNDLHAYFGIHELPYTLAGGTKIQRPESFLGAPNTGGCIALAVGDAQKVYQFADVGTPVVIYQ